LISAVTDVADHDGRRTRSCATSDRVLAPNATAAPRSIRSGDEAETRRGIAGAGASSRYGMTAARAGVRRPGFPDHRPTTSASRARVAAT
jgi:hypothetical protein